MDFLKKLVQTLDAIVEAHSRLLEMATAKRDILIHSNIEGLQDLIHQENACIEEITILEQERKQQVQAFFLQKGINGQSFTLDELLEIQEVSPYKAAITRIAKQLRLLIKDITQLNENNQMLIQTSISFLQYSIGLHVRKEQAVGYGPNSGNRYSSLLDAKI